MKSAKILVLFLFATFWAAAQQFNYVQQMAYDDYSVFGRMNIGGGKLRRTNASAYLEIGDSLYSRKGLLFPRGNKDSVANPVRGLVIFDIPTGLLQAYNGIAWMPLGAGANNLAGSGAGGRLALWNSGNSLTYSSFYDNGNNAAVGGEPSLYHRLKIYGDAFVSGDLAVGAAVHSGSDYKVLADAAGKFKYVPDVAIGNWGGLGGNINAQTDLINKFNNYQPLLPMGASADYLKGNQTLGNLITDVRAAGDGYFRKVTDQQPASSIYDFVIAVRQLFNGDGTNISVSPSGVISYIGAGGSSTPVTGAKSVSITNNVAQLVNDVANPLDNSVYGKTVTGKGWQPAAVINANGAQSGMVVTYQSPNNYNLKQVANVDATGAAPGKVVTYRGPGDYYLTTPTAPGGSSFSYVQFTATQGQTTTTNAALDGKIFILFREHELQSNGSDFTVSGSTITFTPALWAGEKIIIQINP